MKYFSLFSGEKVLSRTGKKIVPSKEAEILLEAKELIEKTQKDVLDYKESTAKECEILKEEAENLYYNGPDQSIVNYMTLKLGIDVCNLSKTLAEQEVTGCCVTSPHFEQKNGYLLDKGVRLTYLHYIGISSKVFKRLCQGENLDFPYRDIFLHYRYLNAPEDLPDFNEPLRSYQPPQPSITKKLKRKFSKIFGND